MITLPALLFTLPLVGASLPTASVDCDRDGTPELVRIEGTSVRFANAAPQAIQVAPTEIADVKVGPMGGGDQPVCRVDLVRRATSSEALLFRKVSGAWQFWLRTPAGASADGERRIELALDRSGGLTRWETTPETVRCDGEQRLFASRWDGDKFVAEALPFPTGATMALAPTPAARVGGSAYRLNGASAVLGVDEGADRLAPPSELADRDVATTWQWRTPRGLAWLVARRAAGRAPLQAIELDMPARDRPTRVALLIDSEPARVAVIPPQGTTFQLALTSPASPRCVALVFDAGASAGNDEASLRTLQLAGVRFLDGGAVGVPGQLEEYLRGELPVSALLKHAATPAFAAALAAAWTDATAPEQRHRLAELTARASASLPAAQRCAWWQRAGDAERSLLGIALGRDGAAVQCLTTTLGDAAWPETTRVDAANRLGTLAPPEAIAPLLAAFPASPLLDAACGRALAATVNAKPALQAELVARATPKADALLYYVARLVPALQPPLVDRLQQGLDTLATLPFETAFLLLDAVAFHSRPRFVPPLLALHGDPKADAALVWRATLALGALDDDASQAALRRALTHTDLRVRLAALDGLVRRKQAVGGEVVKLLDDRWPAAQARAATALGPLCANDATLAPTIVARLEAARVGISVQRELLGSYLACPVDPTSLLVKILDNKRAAPELRALAVVRLVERPTLDAGTPDRIARALLAILDDPSADERQSELMLALVQALGRLGKTSHEIEKALGAALIEPSLPMLRRAAYEAVAAICPPDGPAALQRGTGDPAAEVAAAARRGLATCPRPTRQP